MQASCTGAGPEFGIWSVRLKWWRIRPLHHFIESVLVIPFFKSAETTFADTAGGKDSLKSVRLDDHGIDLIPVIDDDKGCNHRGPGVVESNGEGASAIGIHRVSACGRLVAKIRNY